MEVGCVPDENLVIDGKPFLQLGGSPKGCVAKDEIGGCGHRTDAVDGVELLLEPLGLR